MSVKQRMSVFIIIKEYLASFPCNKIVGTHTLNSSYVLMENKQFYTVKPDLRDHLFI